MIQKIDKIKHDFCDAIIKLNVFLLFDEKLLFHEYSQQPEFNKNICFSCDINRSIQLDVVSIPTTFQFDQKLIT